MKTRNLLIIIVLIAVAMVVIAASSAYGLGSGHRHGNSSLKISPDSKLIAFAFGPEVYPIKLIDLETGETINTFPAEKYVSDLSFSPNGDLLAASITLLNEPSRGVIRVWNIHTDKEIAHTNTPAVFHITFLEDNETVIYDGSKQWNIEDGTTMETDLKLLNVTHSVDFPQMSGAGFREKGIYVTADRKEA